TGGFSTAGGATVSTAAAGAGAGGGGGGGAGFASTGFGAGSSITGSGTGTTASTTGSCSSTTGTGAAGASGSATCSAVAGFAVLTRRGRIVGVAGFGGSGAVLPPCFFAGGASANNGPGGSAMLRLRACRSTN